MKAEIFHLYEQIGVCLIEDDDGTLYVGECVVREGDDVQIMEHSLRKVWRSLLIDVELSPEEDPRPQEVADRVVLGLQRFRNRLSDVNSDSLKHADTDELREALLITLVELAALRARL